MANGDNQNVQELLLNLADRLSKTKGKKVYGYLASETKDLVDSILRELLPGNNHSTLHFELKPEFGVFSLSPHRIISQYICVKNVMKKYISFS